MPWRKCAQIQLSASCLARMGCPDGLHPRWAACIWSGMPRCPAIWQIFKELFDAYVGQTHLFHCSLAVSRSRDAQANSGKFNVRSELRS